MQSYPTPPGAAQEERMSPGFLKLHPGAPVHVFTQAEDEDFHDHPFDFTTHLVAGSYVEEVVVARADGTHAVETVHRAAGTSHRVEARTIHRIVALPDGFCVTRAEYGPAAQVPGFYRLQADGSLLQRLWYQADWYPFRPA